MQRDEDFQSGCRFRNVHFEPVTSQLRHSVLQRHRKHRLVVEKLSVK